jgi:uncharacterized protein (TIGR02246 family)
MRKNLICLGFLATILLVIPAFSGQGQPATNGEQTIRKSASVFIDALNKGDLDRVMASWAPDADLIDAAGKTIRGHDALAAHFKTRLRERKGARFTGKVKSVKFLRPEVALVDGEVQTTLANGERELNRYAMVWVKSGGKWRISSARDLPAEVEEVPSLTYPHLRPLEWMVGDWADEAGTVQIKCKWAPNKSFLLMDYEVKRKGADPLLVTQRVGWDPVNRRVRSWVHDSTGGFGEGYWEHQGHKWVVGASGILADGGTGESTNIYEYKDDRTILYRSVDREVDGQPVADVEVKLVRKTAR